MPLTHAERQKRCQEKQKEKYGEKAVQEKESRGEKQRDLKISSLIEKKID